MATAHLIYGYIGVGKTTFARQLEEELAAVRFSPDEWLAVLFGDDESTIPVDVGVLVARLEEAMAATWLRCLALGLDVVLDMGLWRRGQRGRVRERAAGVGADTRLYHVWCDEEIAWQRVERRNTDPAGSLRMVRNTFEVLKAKMEPLGSDEPHVAIRT